MRRVKALSPRAKSKLVATRSGVSLFVRMLFKAHIEQGGWHVETFGRRSPEANGRNDAGGRLLPRRREVCHGEGHYLGYGQTLERMKTDYVYPELSDRSTPEEWSRSGSRTMRALAKDGPAASPRPARGSAGTARNPPPPASPAGRHPPKSPANAPRHSKIQAASPSRPPVLLIFRITGPRKTPGFSEASRFEIRTFPR